MAIQLRNTGVAHPGRDTFTHTHTHLYTEGYLSWLAKSASRAEKLKISTLEPSNEYTQTYGKDYPLLPRGSLLCLLSRLSTSSPKLRTLTITCPQHMELFSPHRVPQECTYQWQGFIWHHWAESLQLLRQVEHLYLEVEFVPVSDGQGPHSVCPPPQDFFRGMALQVGTPLPTPMPV